MILWINGNIFDWLTDCTGLRWPGFSIASQERPMEEQAVTLQPMDNTWSRSSHSVMEEPMGQQWMRPEGGTAHGYTHRSTPGSSSSPWRTAHCGAGGLRELPPQGPMWSSAWGVGPVESCWRRGRERLRKTGRDLNVMDWLQTPFLCAPVCYYRQ